MPESGVAAVVFDLDGVLIDSEPVWDAAKHEVTERAGGRWREGAGIEMLGRKSGFTQFECIDAPIIDGHPRIIGWLRN